MIFSGKDVCLGLPTTPHEALHTTCLIDEKKRGEERLKAFGFFFYDDSQTLAVEYLSTKTKKFKTREPKISSASFALARVRFFNGSLR